MIRVTVEIVPFGVEAGKETVGSLIIGNDGTGTQKSGNYKYKILGKEFEGYDLIVFHEGHLYKFQKSKGFWELVRCVLNDVPNLVEERNGKD